MDVCVIGCGPAGISGAICLEMAGYDVTQEEIRKRADRLIEKEFLAKYEIRGNWFFEENKLAAYRITRLGEKLAMQEGVHMHKGNCCQSFQQRLKSNLWDGSVQVRRMLMANELALGLIRDGRVSYVCQADYRQESELDNLVKAIIDKIVADVNLQKFEINE